VGEQMGDINQVLSQDEIDNLVTKSASKKPAVSHSTVSLKNESLTNLDSISVTTVDDTPKIKMENPAPAPRTARETTPVTGHHEECIAAGEIQALGQRISELSSRLAKIENSLIKLEKKSQSPNEVSASQIKTAIQQMRNVSSQVEIITEGLRGTAGYNLNKTFKCSSCKSTGVVAIKVKCTQCGQENWWGWWPKKK
jgi:hypothetical protein